MDIETAAWIAVSVYIALGIGFIGWLIKGLTKVDRQEKKLKRKHGIE